MDAKERSFPVRVRGNARFSGPAEPMGLCLRLCPRCVNPKLENSFSFAHLGSMLIHPITPAQIRAGRGLLKWTQGVLASRASISAVTLNMIESDQVAPRTKTLDAIRTVLEGEGIRFIGDAAEGFGVMMRPRADAPANPSANPSGSKSLREKTSSSMRAAG